ncbi:hypothetical protein CEXT_746101 [Caerostris extrusa]|uniref:Uncharacterized protein n=1 Tax=Caerostris extrusa TaxID=172846 RepID=A0AAV4VX67_CAEEX|nr:hypothetical protein CEXT_746101 [Caerostris extrusa]
MSVEQESFDNNKKCPLVEQLYLRSSVFQQNKTGPSKDLAGVAGNRFTVALSKYARLILFLGRLLAADIERFFFFFPWMEPQECLWLRKVIV